VGSLFTMEKVREAAVRKQQIVSPLLVAPQLRRREMTGERSKTARRGRLCPTSAAMTPLAGMPMIVRRCVANCNAAGRMRGSFKKFADGLLFADTRLVVHARTILSDAAKHRQSVAAAAL
jgi:hypothetical protein